MSRELDTECARALGHTVDVNGEIVFHRHDDEPRIVVLTEDKKAFTAFYPVPHYSSDHAAARLLENEIERCGLQASYMTTLFEIVFEAPFEQYTNTNDAWVLIRATPEQRCGAFLKAVE